VRAIADELEELADGGIPKRAVSSTRKGLRPVEVRS
jgi:hypothetical protein